ncbi:selenocysteine-specific translation elongation factor [Corynebacterium sp. MSK105]|uniref:selenocysteine-specific translation elongation factor n=1 Tax=unclassified Corynebacterium TaxID=2624378 RepID=UPI001CE499B3|nr:MULTISPECIES: selenocysteine-specific translation elongation factor [unclassified Corynebacterium]MDK8482034.1 selenocysteine-specific translation elongation factor [Corynebacterium sp. MSK074]MDK8689534.1 selenocysteine-specific translation elongation factor [Corynebacterium sp. MSK105]
MYVVATAGHVDHGKSTLVRALTEMDPDRWEEEQRRGLTIDLGFAWTTLPSGADVAFVDVPGHEKFLGNMLAGVGPAPVVLFVVAADEGWQAQSTDHRDALRALGVEHGIIALTRSDRATVDRTAEIRTQLAGTPLADAPIIPVSAPTGDGIAALRQALDEVLAAVPVPDAQAPVRLWVDRAFSVKGAGTVVTGTLAAGTLRVGDSLKIATAGGERDVEVRGLHSENRAQDSLGPVTRAAVNLRGADATDIHRGDVLLTPSAWRLVDHLDVRRTFGAELDGLPDNLVVHTGTAGVEAHLRPLSADFARISLAHPLPLRLLDRFVVRSPGGRHVVAGVEAVDLRPPELNRRGAARRRAKELSAQGSFRDPASYLRRVGFARVDDLARDGFTTAAPPQGIIAFRDWWIAASQVTRWKHTLTDALHAHTAAHPLAPGMPRKAAMDALGLQEEGLLGLAIAAAKAESSEGVLRLPGQRADLGAAERGVAAIEERLKAEPFAAPEADDLTELGLGPKELAAAERAGRLLRLKQGIVLLPSAPEEARRRLAGLEQPFTLSAARQALGTTRRVAIPLLEYLDAQRITRRGDGGQRTLR